MMSQQRLNHKVDSTVTVEIPGPVATEVALRTSPDASRAEIRDCLEDHVHRQFEFVLSDGRSAIDAISSSSSSSE
jgi:hypothetical protein